MIHWCLSRQLRDYYVLEKSGVFIPGDCIRHLNKDANEQINLLIWDFIKATEHPFLKKLSGQDIRGTEYPDPHTLFDAAFYVEKYFPNGIRCNPFVHYLKKGWKKGYWPGPFFDPRMYAEKCNWHLSDGNPLCHYLLSGGGLDRGVPGPYFDVDFYLDRNSSLLAERKEILCFYRLFGVPGKKSPLPVFDPEYYRSQVIDTAGEFDAFSHYMANGEGETLRPAAMFEPDYYLRKIDLQQTDAKKSRIAAFLHYLYSGVFQGLYCDGRLEQLEIKPLISLLVPVYRPAPHFLNNCIRSVLYQAYPHWELCLVDDCSQSEEIRSLLQKWAERDTRIKVRFLEKNSGIARATNAAAEMATGEFFGLLDNDDELSIDCLFHVVKAINETGAEFFYSDEDLIGEDGSRFSIFRKPDFNPELLLSHNYITHFVVMSRRLFEQVDGCDSRFDGAQDYDLMLKLSEKTDLMYHIPQVLYHWRASESSTSINHSQKNYAHDAGRNSLAEAFARRGIAARAVDGEHNFFYRMKSHGIEQPAVSILFCGLEEGGQNLVSSLETLVQSTTQPNLEIICSTAIETGSFQPDYNEDESLSRVTWLPVKAGMSRAESLHLAAATARGEYLVFVEGPVIGLNTDWIERMLDPFLLESVSIVCGRVLHAGKDGPSYTVPDLQDKRSWYLYCFLMYCSRHASGVHCLQQVLGTGWEFSMIRKQKYLSAGGLDYSCFPDRFGMFDLSLRLGSQKEKIVYTPHACMDKGGIPWGAGLEDEVVTGRERKQFVKKWYESEYWPDPFYNLALLEDQGIGREQFFSFLGCR